MAQFEEQDILLKEASGEDNTQAPAQAADRTAAEKPNLGERYTVLSLIGSGAMASVYKIYDKALGKVFAAKIMKDELLAEPTSLKRFADEASAASAMTHGNIAAVYSHGVTSNKLPFLCMDYLEGETLEQILNREGKLDPQRATLIFQQICEALIHAHMKGVVHRDLKPANIFISKNDSGVELVKLVDFGIAKLQWKSEDSTKLTQTGALIGSPDYMSPEQCRGSEQDARSDLYSLGCVMYHAINGRPPFSGANPVKIVLQHIKEEPQAFHQSELSPDKTLQALEACILRCLEKESRDRFQSADELLSQLHSLEYKHKTRNFLQEAKAVPWRRFFAQLTDGLVLTFLVQAIGYLLFGSQNLFLPDGISHTASWQLALVNSYCHSAGPVLSALINVLCFGVLICPALNAFLVLLAMSIPFFGSVGGAILIPMAPFIYAAYCIIFESSALRGTLGQCLFGVEVVNEQAGRISFRQASWRFICKSIWPIILLGTIATTPWQKASKARGKTSGPRVWQFFKYFPTDGFSKTYLIKKQAGQKLIDRENYVPCASSIDEKKLQLMQRRWIQNSLLHLFVCIPVFLMIYALTPSHYLMFIPLLAFLSALPILLIQYRIHRLKKLKKKTLKLAELPLENE